MLCLVKKKKEWKWVLQSNIIKYMDMKTISSYRRLLLLMFRHSTHLPQRKVKSESVFWQRLKT